MVALEDAMRCDLPSRDWRTGLTARAGFAVAAGGLVVVAMVLDSDLVALAVLVAAGVVFAAGFGIPVATAVQVGQPIGNLVAALADRQQNMTIQIRQRLLPTLTGVVGDVTLDRTRATDLVEQAITRVVARWRGSVGEDFDTYLLCWAVKLALTDAWLDPVMSEDDPRVPLLRLSRDGRAIWALRRYGKSDEHIAHMLGCSAEQVACAAGPARGDER
jgi:hypothetical protein